MPSDEKRDRTVDDHGVTRHEQERPCIDPFADPLRDGTGLHAAFVRGTRLNGKYEIRDLIGAGGMAAVYRAVQIPPVSRTVAIKVLQPREALDAEMRARFELEAVALSKLQHPNVITLHDFGTQEGLCFLVMEYLDGRSLSAELGAPMEPLRAAGIMRQICDALTAAHRAGIVHRDLKPGNIFLVEINNNRDFVKILDFGISKLFTPNGPRVVTLANQRLGTPRYMSPEQVHGSEIDHRADIYAAGCVLYELLAGRPVFIEPAYEQLLEKHALHPPPRFSEIGSNHIDHDLESIVRTMLAKRPEERFQSADAVNSALALWEARAATEGRTEAASIPDLVVTREMKFPEAAAEHAPRVPHAVASDRAERGIPGMHWVAWLLAFIAVGFAGGALILSAPDRTDETIPILAEPIATEIPPLVAPPARAEPIAVPVEPRAEESAEEPAKESAPRGSSIGVRKIQIVPEAADRTGIEQTLRARTRALAQCFTRTQPGELARRTLHLRFVSSSRRQTLHIEPHDPASEAFLACVHAMPPIELEKSQTKAIAVVTVAVGPIDKRGAP